MMVRRPSRGKGKPKPKVLKTFSDLHGSRSDVFKGVTPEQLGHDQQLPVNPPTEGGSPLINPGSPGHPMGPGGRLGEAMGNDPSGEEFY